MLQSMASGELMMSADPEALKKKLLKPPNERQRQETLDILNIVNTPQDDPHYDSIVNLVTLPKPCGVVMADSPASPMAKKFCLHSWPACERSTTG